MISANKTSAKLLMEFAFRKWGSSDDLDSPSNKLFLMANDLYIKARSYALINKIAFWLALISGLTVLAWPSLSIIAADFGLELQTLNEAIVQTTVTALAAFTFTVYSHYKKRQMFLENLMRHLIYSEEPYETLVANIVKEIERIDIGFNFQDALATEADRRI